MHAWAEVCHLSKSSKSVLIGFLCGIGWRIIDSLHINYISNSAILRNNYISLLSDLCACIHVMKKWRHKGSHSSAVSSLNHLIVKCCFVWKQSQIWTSRLKKKKRKKKKKKKKKKEKHFGHLASFCFNTFSMLFSPLGVLFVMKTLEDEW